jgi:hypothetical protein
MQNDDSLKTRVGEINVNSISASSDDDTNFKPTTDTNSTDKTPPAAPPATPPSDKPQDGTTPKDTSSTAPIADPVPPVTSADSKDDGEEFPIFQNDAGDYVDKDGNLIVSKADAKFDNDGNLIIDSLPGDTVIQTIQNKLATDFGFEFVGPDNKPIQYPDTDEGIGQLVKDAIVAGVEAERDAIFNAYPQLNDFFNHLRAGQDPATFFAEEQRWSSYNLPVEDDASEAAKAVRKSVILENFKHRFGYDEATGDEKKDILARATDYVNLIEDGGKLNQEAKSALKDLQKRDAAIVADRNKRNADLIAAKQEANTKYWNSVAATIDKGDLKGITIPEHERKAFYDYIGKDVTGKGESQESLDRENEDIAFALQLAYMRFKKFDLDALVKVKATHVLPVTLSKRRATYKISNAAKGSRTEASKNLSDIKLSNLL